MNRDVGERKEKIESKGAYSHDLHEAIRDVRRSFASDNFDRIGASLNALFDICAPEIREAIVGEWSRIDEEYRDVLEKIKTAEFRTHYKRNGWETDYRGNIIYYVNIGDLQTTPRRKEEIAQETRNKMLTAIWSDIYRKRFRVCIDCLDRHGELRKWRAVEYGKV